MGHKLFICSSLGKFPALDNEFVVLEMALCGQVGAGSSSCGRDLRSAGELANVTVAIMRAVMWVITKPRMCEVKFVNAAADSTEELGGPFRRYKSQVITVSMKAAVKCLPGLRA